MEDRHRLLPAAADVESAGDLLERVGDGVEDGREAAGADAHVRLRLEVLEPHLDGGPVDPDPAWQEESANRQTSAVQLAGGHAHRVYVYI